ncbi:MAG TPA: hypothetical protein VEJ63_24115 [Planctomycetota bacterium]|nr:hypothetical protein [Planctomycetota bacterium]
MNDSAGNLPDLKPLAQWYVHRWHRALWFLPLTVGLMGLIAVLLVRGSMEDPRANYEKSRAAVAALKRAPVPDEQNAWLVYERARGVRVIWVGHSDTDPQYKTDGESEIFALEDVQIHWKDNAAAIALLHSAGDMSECDMGLDQVANPFSLPSLLNTRECANLLAIDARCQALAGNHKAAAKSLRAIRRLARHLETQPLLLNQMIATSFDAMVNEVFHAIICFDTPSTIDDLEAYKHALAGPGEPFERAARCLKYESAVFLYTFDGAAAGLMKPQTRNPPIGMMPLWYGSDRNCYLGVIGDALQSFEQHRWPEGFDDSIQRHQRGPSVITRMVGTTPRAWLALFVTEERARVAVTAAAFLQFRAKHGRDPKDIGDLVPTFLPQVPMAALFDTPVRWTSEPLNDSADRPYISTFYKDRKSIRIYTVGLNGIDEGGNGNYMVVPGENEPDDATFYIPALERVAK